MFDTMAISVVSMRMTTLRNVGYYDTKVSSHENDYNNEMLDTMAISVVIMRMTTILDTMAISVVIISMAIITECWILWH